MAQIFPDDISNSPELSQLSRALCNIFEKNLSDEWECHAILAGSKISHFIVLSPDLGVLILLISKCLPNQFNSFFQSIPEILKKRCAIIRNELQKHEQLCNENGVLSFPMDSGILFPELSISELSINIGTLSKFSIFADKLNEVSSKDDELEELLFDMVEEGIYEELSQENFDFISQVIPRMYNLLINEVLEPTNESGENNVAEKADSSQIVDEENLHYEEKTETSSATLKGGFMGFLGKAACAVGIHKWTEWEYKSSNLCLQIHTCKRCKKEGNRTVHSWGSWDYIYPSSCDQKRVCKRCGEQENRINHNWGEWEYNDSTSCMQFQTCHRCGEKSTERENHAWGVWEYDSPTSCTLVRFCRRCHQKETGKPTMR